ncbi:MAG: polyprenol monophosphomannose synthase [Actinomycetota bacterium]|nr:polyprenol monophosphomannose synthase [Actinomycetota bacterium]
MTSHQKSPDSARIVIVIPTYNEAQNVSEIVLRIQAAVPSAHTLIVDDGSPDGTGNIADDMARSDDRIHVLHRTQKAGLGRAYLAGFEWALARDFEIIGEMDADGSHQPEELPRLVQALEGADLVIGSRWVPGGTVVNWPLSRRLLSRGGNIYTRFLLGMGIRDATAGYRLFWRHTLESIDIQTVEAQGYVFQTELAFRTLGAGLRVVEVPIEFVERVRGDSKMTGSVATESLRRITRWGIRERRAQLARWLRRNNRRHSSVEPHEGREPS